MKKCYLDANFLVFLQDSSSAFYPQAAKILQNLIDEKIVLFVSSLVLDEFLMGSLRLSGKGIKDMKSNLRLGLKSIFKLPNFNLTTLPSDPEKHLKVINLMAKWHLKPRDAYHLFIMLENRIKYLATFDHDFDSVFRKGLVKKFS